MEEVKTREQTLVEGFCGLSLAETVVELRRMGVKPSAVEDGYVILYHPFYETDEELIYPGTLLKITARPE